MPRQKNTWSAADSRFMAMAFAEARKVKGKTLPNPAVGAVLVKGGKVIARGGTRPAGQAHAEVVALEKAGKRARNGTLYVTLEPCCHHGKTPPCTSAILAAGVRRVVAAIADPNPRVKGGGFRLLRRAGLDVRVGLMEAEAAEFYAGFFFRITRGRPLIILKIAQSLDGRINARPGEETPITGPGTQVWAHALRARVDAVLVGGRTLRGDDPDLTPRLAGAGAPHPEALVLSRRGPFPAQLKLMAQGRKSQTVVLAQAAEGLPPWVRHVPLGAEAAAEADTAAMKARVGAELLAFFRTSGYHAVLVEGGREVWQLFLEAGLCDLLYVVTAPRFLPEGESWATKLPGDWGKSFKFRKFSALGNDFLAEFERVEFRG